jgi:uncharacterized coiled-coil protein SlyX
LEVLVAFQERALADLNDVVLSFTGRVEALERELRQLRSRVEQPEPEVGPQDDPPPHY